MCPYIPPRWRWALEALLMLNVAVFLALVGPPEKTLGANIRAVYLHGAWIWAALLALTWAALQGARALVRHDPAALRASRLWGWMGLVLWWLYLPLSLWAMQTNWNGLFLSEPRWRAGVELAIVGLLLQGAAWFLPPRATAWINMGYLALIGVRLSVTERVLHPPSPMFTSRAWAIQLTFFATLLALVWMARAWVRWLDLLLPPWPDEA